jgi:murein L,D-transpeptidase YcbB/YkuD
MRLGSIAMGAAGLTALAGGGLWLAGTGRPSAVQGGKSAAVRHAAPRAASLPPWTDAELRDLSDAVAAADREGLRPSDYGAAALRAIVEAKRTGPGVDAIANGAALALARDYAAGRIRNRHRFNWYIDGTGPDSAVLAGQVAAARGQGRLSGWLHGLLPAGADYLALRRALAEVSADEPDRRDRILANMERWRWLPRGIAQGNQLYVNLPTYRLEVIEDGRTIDTYNAVIGATDMPTPALSAPVRQVIANPDWIVPPSIVRRSHLRPGASSRYIFSTRPDGTLRVRQKPGPGNALGRVKIEFPNRLAIYFHDTPAKSLFGASERAFSHGCVRVQRVEALAASIVDRPDRLATALQGIRTQSFRTARRWQATIVYLTLARGEDGALDFVGDPYRMDAPLAAALEGRRPRQPAPATVEPSGAGRPAAAVPDEPPPEASTIGPGANSTNDQPVDTPPSSPQP